MSTWGREGKEIPTGIMKKKETVREKERERDEYAREE
jgi:hypothetical protein